MHFRKLADNLGMIFIPECAFSRKKHSCPDCFSCQQCANERCHACQAEKVPKKQKHRKSGRERK